jgi:hypothetical protein
MRRWGEVGGGGGAPSPSSPSSSSPQKYLNGSFQMSCAAATLGRALPTTQAENILAKETKETPVIVDHIGREHPYKGFLVSHGRP